MQFLTVIMPVRVLLDDHGTAAPRLTTTSMTYRLGLDAQLHAAASTPHLLLWEQVVTNHGHGAGGRYHRWHFVCCSSSARVLAVKLGAALRNIDVLLASGLAAVATCAAASRGCGALRAYCVYTLVRLGKQGHAEAHREHREWQQGTCFSGIHLAAPATAALCEEGATGADGTQ